MFPINSEPNWWDCHVPKFTENMESENYDSKLLETFPQFKLITNELHHHGKRGFFILKKRIG
jgi:hypothetical protein